MLKFVREERFVRLEASPIGSIRHFRVNITSVGASWRNSWSAEPNTKLSSPCVNWLGLGLPCSRFYSDKLDSETFSLRQSRSSGQLIIGLSHLDGESDPLFR